MTSSRACSMIERRPRAPVSRSSALSEIDQSVLREDELDGVVVEEALELLDEGVSRLEEDLDECPRASADAPPRRPAAAR